jgi:hypothetical protein
MAKNNEPSKIAWQDITYVINNLPPKDLDIIDDGYTPPISVSDFLTQEIESGGTVKFQYDYAWGDCPNVSLVYYRDGFNNSGFGISARGSDFDHAMAILMYKFFEVAQGRLFEVMEARKKRRYG